MPSSLRFTTLLLALTGMAFGSGLTTYVMAQPTATEPILQVEETLQAGFYNVHEFSGQANQTVTMLLESEAFDAYLILEDSQGNRIATNNNISFDNTNAALVIELPAAGHYRVIANAYQATTQGLYRLTIQPTPANQPNPLLNPVEMTLLEANQKLQAGIEHFKRSEFRIALVLWEESLTFFLADEVRTTFFQDSRQGEAASLGNLGLAYYSLGEYDRAIEFHQQSLNINQEIGNRQGEAQSLGNLGITYSSLGEYGRAIDFFQQTLNMTREIGDRQGEVTSLNNLGNAYYTLGESRQAIDFFLQKLDIDREIGNREGQASALGNLGNAFLSLSNYDRALYFYQQALTITREIGNRQKEASALGGLGNAYRNLGDYVRAIDAYQQRFDIAQKIGDHREEASALGGLGNTYRALGEYGRAIDFYQQWLVVTPKIRTKLGQD